MIFKGLKISEVSENQGITFVRLQNNDLRLVVVAKDNLEFLKNAIEDDEWEVVIRKPCFDEKEITTDSRKYVFGLMRQLAKPLRLTELAVYETMLRQTQNGTILTISTKAYYDGALEQQGIKHYDVLKIENGWVGVKAYYGISMMDQQELNAFTDHVKEACALYGIDTTTPSEKGLLNG